MELRPDKLIQKPFVAAKNVGKAVVKSVEPQAYAKFVGNLPAEHREQNARSFLDRQETQNYHLNEF